MYIYVYNQGIKIVTKKKTTCKHTNKFQKKIINICCQWMFIQSANLSGLTLAFIVDDDCILHIMYSK